MTHHVSLLSRDSEVLRSERRPCNVLTPTNEFPSFHTVSNGFFYKKTFMINLKNPQFHATFTDS